MKKLLRIMAVMGAAPPKSGQSASRFSLEMLEGRQLLSAAIHRPLAADAAPLPPVEASTVHRLENVSTTDANEGDLVTVTGTLIAGLPQGRYNLLIDWGDGQQQTVRPLAGAFSYTHRYADDNPSGTSKDVYLIRLTATDINNNSTIANTSTRISNVTPTLDLPAAEFVGMNAVFSKNVKIIDPGSDFWIVTVDYGDGQNLSVPTVKADKSFDLTRTYNTLGPRTITIKITDDDGASHTQTLALDVVTPTVLDEVIVNDGQRQRSGVKRLSVYFAGAVTIDAGAFRVENGAGKTTAVKFTTSVVGGRSVVNIGFKGAGVVGGSLADGKYKLLIDGSKVHGLGGDGANASFSFIRLFGDTDGNGTVDQSDAKRFNASLNKASRYRDYLDSNADGRIDTKDLAQFKKRVGKTISPFSS
jgi:hypothetical protein